MGLEWEIMGKPLPEDLLLQLSQVSWLCPANKAISALPPFQRLLATGRSEGFNFKYVLIDISVPLFFSLIKIH